MKPVIHGNKKEKIRTYSLFFENFCDRSYIMKKFRKTFNLSATNVEIDNYIQSVLKGPKVDPEDDVIVSVVGDEDHQYASVKVPKKKLQ